jgi:rhodanese-related sulfurtransferase
MSLPSLKPEEAKRLLDQGATLVDIREPHEHARERIPGAHHLPLSKLGQAELAVQSGQPVIFHCKSGARTRGYAPRLAGTVGRDCKVYIVEGGIDAWRRAGLPVASDGRQPAGLPRQLQIGAGSLAFAGMILGLAVSPWLFVIPLLVGAGLIAAGRT